MFLHLSIRYWKFQFKSSSLKSKRTKNLTDSYHWDQNDPHCESLKATLSLTVRWRPALHKWAEIYSAIFLLAKSLRGSTLEQNMPKYKGIREIKWCFEIVYRKLSQQRVEVLVIQEKYGEWNQKQDKTNSGNTSSLFWFFYWACWLKAEMNSLILFSNVSPSTSWLITGENVAHNGNLWRFQDQVGGRQF